ncbi:MAG: hypothetical protein KDI82_16275 [Gammaproteobacteria bacterium]|nr:hypothetical protein [Gammaproteobacteria bacterium]
MPAPCVLSLLLCLLTSAAVAGGADGRWRLSIDGHNSYLFGEPQLGGGVRIPWQVDIEFRVRDGQFELGTASARLDGDAEPLSYPPSWFDCRQVEGTYLDSSLSLHETPRIRFAKFPVAGEVDGKVVRLRPGYEPPGNYLAVTYECVAADGRASEWFGLAERGKQVMGKRQDAEKQSRADGLHARVREVVALPPESSLELPLVDGWQFSFGTPQEQSWRRYRLVRE